MLTAIMSVDEQRPRGDRARRTRRQGDGSVRCLRRNPIYMSPSGHKGNLLYSITAPYGQLSVTESAACSRLIDQESQLCRVPNPTNQNPYSTSTWRWKLFASKSRSNASRKAGSVNFWLAGPGSWRSLCTSRNGCRLADLGRPINVRASRISGRPRWRYLPMNRVSFEG